MLGRQPQPIGIPEKKSSFGLPEKNKNIIKAASALKECANALRNGGVIEKVLSRQAMPQVDFIYSLDIKSLEDLEKAINMGDKYQKAIYEKIMEKEVSELGRRLSGGREAITTHFGISLKHTQEKHPTEKEAEKRLENLKIMPSVKQEFYEIAKWLMVILIDIINKSEEYKEKVIREKVLGIAVEAVIKKANELVGKTYNEDQLKKFIKITIEEATTIKLDKAA